MTEETPQKPIKSWALLAAEEESDEEEDMETQNQNQQEEQKNVEEKIPSPKSPRTPQLEQSRGSRKGQNDDLHSTVVYALKWLEQDCQENDDVTLSLKKSQFSEEEIKDALEESQVEYSSIFFKNIQDEIQPFFKVKREKAIDMINKRQLNIYIKDQGLIIFFKTKHNSYNQPRYQKNYGYRRNQEQNYRNDKYKKQRRSPQYQEKQRQDDGYKGKREMDQDKRRSYQQPKQYQDRDNDLNEYGYQSKYQKPQQQQQQQQEEKKVIQNQKKKVVNQQTKFMSKNIFDSLTNNDDDDDDQC